MIRFDGQVAVITGSGRGLGAAYARLLAERGASVVVHDAGVAADGIGFDPSVADTVVQAITKAGGTAIPCYENIASHARCRQLIDTAINQFGRIDILIHNAGLLRFVPIEETDPQLFERMINVSVAAPFWLSQAAFPVMKQQQYGRIVFTTSGRAMYLEAAMPGLTSYAIGKMAQLGLMNALAAEGEAYGIRVNAISPVAATRMLQRQMASHELRPEQVAPGVAFLASPHCNFSGVVLRASNGNFSVTRWSFSPEVSFGTEVVTPEAIAEQWNSIIGDSIEHQAGPRPL
jgi:NAD(P)-dependent dehydrogenase (short-subunit alcohol dehydrogenase family)